jgi:hypothetical protein
MLIACWSAKGGAGTTVVAAGLALVLSQTRDEGALVADLAGDVPAVLGRPEPDGPGLSEWLATGPDVPPDGLARLEHAVAPALWLLPRGRGPLQWSDRAEVLAAILASDARDVVVDCGRLEPARDGSAGDDAQREVVQIMAASASQSLLVTRSCYLALRRVLAVPVQPSGVILVKEPGRSLTAADIEDVVGAPVVAEVAVDPSVARAVDAGLLAQRVPRGLARALVHAA